MALFTALGTALGATAASAFAVGLGTTAIAAGAGVGAAAASGAFNKPDKSPSVSMPQAPKVGDAQAKAETMALKRRQASARTQSVQTSPLGIAGEAEVTKKKLLGE
jgi:hypothetical protein